MAKDTYYMKHDANSQRDERVLDMRAEWGSEGYGLYWLINEYLREQSDCRANLKKIRAIAFALNESVEKVENFVTQCIEEFDLYVSDGQFFWSERLKKDKDALDAVRDKNRENARKGGRPPKKDSPEEKPVEEPEAGSLEDQKDLSELESDEWLQEEAEERPAENSTENPSENQKKPTGFESKTARKPTGFQQETERKPPAKKSKTGRKPRRGEERKGKESKEKNSNTGDSDEPPTNEKSLTLPDPQKELYGKINRAFLSKNGERFTDYGKEGKAIWGLIKKAQSRSPDSPHDFIKAMITRFWELKNSKDKFWSSQPFLPSALNASGIFDRVLETFREEQSNEISEEEFDELVRRAAI